MATQPTIPIEVNANPLPAALATGLRYGLTFLAGIAITKGILPVGSNVNDVVGALMGLIAAGWGVWRTVFNKRQLVVAAEAAPNSVAVVNK